MPRGTERLSTPDELEIQALLERERRGFQSNEAFWSICHPARILTGRVRRSFEMRLPAGMRVPA